MALQRFYELKQYIELSSKALECILDDYGYYVDNEQAKFIREYLKALKLDFEMAMTRGANDQLELIIEDLEDLKDSTELRLKERLPQNKA